MGKSTESDFSSFWCGKGSKKYNRKEDLHGFRGPRKEERGVDGRYVEYYGEEITEADKYRQIQDSR
jgi:hypothetical protein